MLYINQQTEEVWYEHVDKPLSDEEQIIKLENEVAESKKPIKY